MNAATDSDPGRGAAARDRRYAFLTAAVTWVMFVLMAIPGNFDYSGAVSDTEGANPVTRALWLAIFAICTVVILNRLAAARRLFGHINVFFLLFVALACASMFWSIDPDLTIRRLVRLLIMCSAFIAVAVAAWNPRRLQQVVRPVVTGLLLGSLIFGLARPDLAIHHELFPELLGAWHGLFPTKNGLGAVASFGFIFWMHAWLAREAGRASALFGLAISASCLVLSRSSTSTMATALTALALLLLLRSPGSMRRAVPYLASGLIALILLYSLAMLKVVPGLEIILAPIPMITGKDLTFSNRSEIWAAVVDHVRLRPLLGSGYSAYWSMGLPTPDMESYAVLVPLKGFYPGSSHNGYLQVLNDLGAVGLICLLGYLIVYFRQSLRLYAIDRSQGALFLGLLLQQATINLTEPLWLNVLLIDFVLMSLATTLLARALLEARTGARLGGQRGSGRGPPMVRTPTARRAGARRLVRPRSAPIEPASDE